MYMYLSGQQYQKLQFLCLVHIKSCVLFQKVKEIVSSHSTLLIENSTRTCIYITVVQYMYMHMYIMYTLHSTVHHVHHVHVYCVYITVVQYIMYMYKLYTLQKYSTCTCTCILCIHYSSTVHVLVHVYSVYNTVVQYMYMYMYMYNYSVYNTEVQYMYIKYHNN